ncbi:methyltransferase domain-containing protein [Alkalibacterium indicireducens]|uniref:Methyltransferase domain-containing protein n=2 Tax=Alkalibacterium indicireducens TaxID=398758 RepID=A0ABP3KNQ8_9LACT
MKSEYTRDMLLSRQRLAESGLWAPLLDKIQSLIKHPEGVLLDIGCGEGSHSAYLKKNGYKGPIISFDISKEGINLAAASHEDIFFLTADLARSPFASRQYDTLLNILSPSNYSEFDRLMRQGGQVIKVVPNPGYLKELRELQEESKRTYSNVQVVEKFEEHYTHVRKESVVYTFQLPEELVEDFITMTPLGWHIKADFDSIRTKLKEITVDLLILIGESEDSA